MEIAVCDDEKSWYEAIRSAIADCCDIFKSYSQAVEVEHFTCGEKLLAAMSEGRWFDMIFMDIDMGPEQSDGISACKAIRTFNNAIPIIIVTNHVSFRGDGYEVRAFRYMCKPINIDNFRSAMNSVLTEIAEAKNLLVFMNNRSETIALQSADITHCGQG